MLQSPTLLALVIVLTSTSGFLQEEDPRTLAQRIALPKLERAELALWREHVRPSTEELGYEAIPWGSEFAEGVKRSSEEGKPLLFWAMNGHPLGCT